MDMDRGPIFLIGLGLLVLFGLFGLGLLDRPHSQRGGGENDLCRTNVLDFRRRFNSKKYLSTTYGSVKYHESGPVKDMDTPNIGGPIDLGDRHHPGYKSPRVLVEQYTHWLNSKKPHELNAQDRANLRILRRGGTLIEPDMPQDIPIPMSGRDAYNLVVNVKHMANPEFMGYLPYNFSTGDEEQASMRELNYINPDETLKTNPDLI